MNNRPYIPFTKASLTLQATAADSGLTIVSPRVMVVRVHKAFSNCSIGTYWALTLRYIIYTNHQSFSN